MGRRRPTSHRPQGAAPGVVVIGDGWFPDRPGGLNRYVASLCHAFQALGVEQRVLVLGPCREDPVEGLVDVARVEDPLPLRLLALFRVLRRVVRTGDVVVAHFALNALPALWSRRSSGLVFHFHGPWAAESAVEGASPVVVSAKKRIERLVFRRAEAFVVLSRSFASVLEEEYGVEASRIRVVPPGVDHERFVAGPDAAVQDYAVCVRRLVPRMGLDVLLQAWARSGVRTKLVLVGDGPERPRLEQLAAELGLGAVVEFRGRVSDSALASLYRGARFSVVPSVALEGFGLVALESLASGVPVLGSDLGGLGEVIGDFSPELIVRPGDPVALAARLRDVASGRIPLPSRASCTSFAQRYTWEATAATCLEVYRDAGRQRPAPDGPE
ncbi:glycosyltransferase family 4 protein [Geodermatophilus maliterrae]|uniref:Glycosyltransferase family 4 protein n=1 Tax=Geodermatophilus maliterrae TaxID=3162531 RepID=A0ABV3XFD4_9ACTN